MEEPVSSTAYPESFSTHELLILHTTEAQEWASYLQQILKGSRKFNKKSILLYTISTADQLHGYNFEYFQSCKCIVLLLSGVLLDILCDNELQEALQELLYPPHRVVAFLCGVSEEEILTEIFQDWPSWRKLHAEDEPAVYVSTILETITGSRQVGFEREREREAAAALEDVYIIPVDEFPSTGEIEEVATGEQKENVPKDEEPVSTMNSASQEMTSSTHLTCLTVQPNRVLCGKQETLFIIFKDKVDDQLVPEVEFSSENVPAKRVPGTVENEYTISVTAPDMHAGIVSLTMYTGQSRVSLTPVTYYTCMGEVSRYLDKATDPVNFICQAFNLTANATESLDSMLSESLKSRLPATGLQLFGIRQIEEDNMAAYQQNDELPTLLHFAAKYGLKKLTTILLQCPGALQAYSVMNKNGDYPNTLAEKSGFNDLRQFMDEFVETADLLKSHFEDTISTEESAEIYEMMSTTSQDIMMKYSGCTEDIYESMLGINPECAEDLYEVMTAVDENPEEAMLRKFFQAKPNATEVKQDNEPLQSEEEKVEDNKFKEIEEEEEEEEDPYNICPEDIYDTVDANTTYNPVVLNRPPAPIPRPETETELEKSTTYISRVFSDKSTAESKAMVTGHHGEMTAFSTHSAPSVAEPPVPAYDPYAGMKTPGQRQLICLQERVKVGEITVDEAVQEFKAWQFDHERRANSIRYQQENLKKLRDSITRRHKKREKTGKELDYEISAPLQRNLYWGSGVTLECAVYESAPRTAALPPPVAQIIQRGSWKTGSTSSTSSTESNRLSTHSTFSYSSGTEPDETSARRNSMSSREDSIESLPPPPRPPRPVSAVPSIPPPRIPPRNPERVPEMVHERYISCPTRALPQRPSYRQPDLAPPVPRRYR